MRQKKIFVSFNPHCKPRYARSHALTPFKLKIEFKIIIPRATKNISEWVR